MEQAFATWQAMASAYLAAPASIFTGTFEPIFLVPLVGIACLAVGAGLAVAKREKQALWALLPLAFAVLAPMALDVAYGILGWLGLGFALVLGAFGLLIWIAVLARDARHKRPVWLIGLFILSILGYCGFLSVALIWGS